MTVKISKPAVNLREELNELKKPTGVAGEAMLRAETPQEQQALIGVGRRNLIINGDFDVWQRGTSFSANAYTADRWISSLGTVTKDGAALKHVSTTTDPYLLYKLEDVGNKLAGNKAVLSFYLKTSGSDNRLQYVTFSGTNYYHSQMYQLPSELEGYTHWVCPVEITSANTDMIRLVIELHNVSGHTSWLRKVQLELGSVATPFEHRSYGEELALCQRYYQKLFDTNAGTYSHRWQGRIGSVYSTTRVFVTVDLPVEMRSVPTIVFETEGNGFRWNIYSAAADIGPSTSISNTYASRGSVGFDVAPVANMPSGYVGNACHMDVRDGWCHASAEL
jgi:hypothetical protein